MGAGCSNGGAAKVQDSIKPSNITELTQEAQDKLKQLQALNPDGTVNTEEMKKRMMGGKEEDDIRDKDMRNENIQRLKHKELWLAVEMNNPEKVTSYLDTYEEKSGEELKEAELYDHTGNSVIHKAASLGHAEVLMLLLERTGATPDLVNSSLATPLHLACKNARIDAARFLIGCGVDANVQDEHGQVPLLICCIHGHFELARMILEASGSGHLPEPLEIDLKDHRGLSPLNCAAIKGDFDMTKLLILNGNATVDGASPKGCTPLLYAARGGYAEVVRFLLARGASPLRQDNAGGTVLHHAIEKGYTDVLAVLVENGVDVHSAIEIPDNAGRTPIFEAIDNHETPEILQLLTKSRKDGGFEAKVDIMSYNGQTPLFSAVREGNIEVVRTMVDGCGAKVDLTEGELYKEEHDDQNEHHASLEEKFFMDAYKNCMTPLHIAVVLGYDEIMHYLMEKGANPNLQTKIKGYSCLHLAVLANKPEVIIELLTKSQANPYLPDFGGRTLQDMIEIFIPSYLESFKTLLENLQTLKGRGLEENTSGAQDETLAALAKRGEDHGNPTVATHYYNPDDDRSIQQLGGGGEDAAKALIQKAEAEQAAEVKEDGGADDKKNFHQKYMEMDEKDILIDSDLKVDPQIELVFGKKIALSFLAIDWKYKELALKIIYKQTDKYLDVQANIEDSTHSIEDYIKACSAAVSLTSREKVIKVFSVSLQLLNLMISSQKIEKSSQTDILKNSIVEKNIVLKLLQKSEEGNTRITNKIHESLLDLSFNPEIGEALTSSFILQRIQAHNRAHSQKMASKKLAEEGKNLESNEKIETEASLGSYKGLLAQLALLYKFINSFGIASRTRGPLSVKDILKSVIPSVQHPNQDVRNASGKILLDVQKLSGCVSEDELLDLEDKHKNAILTKLKKVEVEKNLNESRATKGRSQKLDQVNPIQEQENEGDETDRAEVPETISMSSPSKMDNIKMKLNDLKQVIKEKGAAKEWQEREVALKAIEEVFENKRFEKKDILEDLFLQDCMILIKTGLSENNMTIYLLTVEIAGTFFSQSLSSDTVLGSLPGLLSPIVLRTTDTNTRIRKKSVDLIYQIWDYKDQSPQDKLKLNQLRDSQNGEMGGKTDSMCQIIAQVICDSSHGEKAIIGRLGLFVKKASLVEAQKDLSNKPLQMVLGKNYEQLTEFACQWITHKNTKIRQNSLRLIVEICRINCMDPRGQPFKQRIVNFILALRPSQRDPLIIKINEVCLKDVVKNTSPSRAGNLESYINVEELELGMAVGAKGRAASMDHAGAKRRLQSGRPGSKAGRKPSDGGVNTGSSAALPSIGGAGGGAPRGTSYPQPVIVLPHSEPLTEDQQQSYCQLIEFFGVQIITAFMAKNWATRLAAIEKVEEQLPNLDPNRRDAMSAEINRQNLPAEVTFGVFLEFMFEGLKDPVLKNYIAVLELFQRALPTFFRYIPPMTLRAGMMHIIREIIRKCTDMKQKIREASTNFCLYLSHQSPVGPEYMVDQVLQELDFVQNEKNQPKNKETAVAQNFGNSQLISSCLGLLNDYQVQTKIIQPGPDSESLLKRFMVQINASLRHSNPQVRKEAEKLFKTLYCDHGQKLEDMLVNQKPTLVSKLLSSAKQDVLANTALNHPTQINNPNKIIKDVQKPMTEAQKLDINVARAQEQIRSAAMDNSQISKVLEGCDQHLNDLKLPNPKKRQKAIVEIKKAISKRIVGKLTQDQARELFEPLTILMRQLLQDENSDIYLEALNLLKFIVGNLAPYLSTLDLHLMMGSFIGIIVQNTAVSSNMRIQVSSDKVIIFFAKHQNIGPFVVAKEINKNLERINRSVMSNVLKKHEILAEKKPTLLRFYGILQLLLQQFSIVLCYQPEFYIKCLECIADSMIASNGKGPNQEGEEVAVKQMCSQIIQNLYAIDYKLLDTTVSKLDDLNRKTPLRKAIIEYESQQKQGKNYIDVGKVENKLVAQPSNAEDQMRDTQMSFASSNQRQSLFSPGSTHTMARGQSPGGFGSSQYDGNWTKINQNGSQMHDAQTPAAVRGSRRMMSHGNRQAAQVAPSEDYLANHPVSSMTQSSWRKRQDLPALEGSGGNLNLNRTGQLLPQINMGMGLQDGANHYKFEVPGGKTEENKADASKFKGVSTRGAGFNSSSTAGGSGQSYEPTSGQRRTPRRTLGVLLNENNGVKAQENMGSSAGMSGAASISWPSQQPGAGLDGTIGGNQLSKPPLYVPGANRPPIRASIDKKPGAVGAYASKTGFSSIGRGDSNSKNADQNASGFGSTGFSSGYVPSVASGQRQPSLGSVRPRSGRKRGDSLTKPPQPKAQNKDLPSAASIQFGANFKN